MALLQGAEINLQHFCFKLMLHCKMSIIIDETHLNLTNSFAMIRFRIRERMADLSFQRGQRITLEFVSEATGIHRATLSKIASQRGCNTTTDNLDKLCRFFHCSLSEMAEYVSDSKEMDEVSEKREISLTSGER